MPRAYVSTLGDMWDSIAHREMGSRIHTAALMEANIEHKKLYILPANIRLTIPDVAPKPPAGLPPWKRGNAT